MLDTPVLFLVFNRPDTTRQVFEAIRQAKPRKLFVAADGPRPTHPHDGEKCRLTRQAALEVDWDCEVKTLFRDDNLGCKYAVSSAIDWFFGQVEAGIILEDDCLPDPSFFGYCRELLHHYRDEPRVMHISGCNWNLHPAGHAASYFFSKYPTVWGWATWRRAWNSYDVEMRQWPGCKSQLREGRLFGSRAEWLRWKSYFNIQHARNIDTWDTQWVMNVWVNNGISITPRLNLVRNLGIGVAEATHTTGEDTLLGALQPHALALPLTHPAQRQTDARHDAYLFEHVYNRWRRQITARQVVHDALYRHLPENVKDFYRKVKRQVLPG